MSNMKDEELREQLAEMQLEHYVKTKGRNLGQYRSEHDCMCGEELYVDGHDPGKANLNVVQARHIADAILQLIKADREAAIREALSKQKYGAASDGGIQELIDDLKFEQKRRLNQPTKEGRDETQV